MEDEGAYYDAITAITATPYDFMVQLDDMGIDFSAISSYELFLLLFRGLQEMDTRLIFGDLDLSKFCPAINEENGMIVLRDFENDIVIDRGVHAKICAVLRKINHLTKEDKHPANEEAKKFMIERARVKQKRRSRSKSIDASQIESLIIALVNTEQFKYGYEEVLDLTVFQFFCSVYQIIKKVNYDNTMIGCYAGTVDMKKLNKDDLNWLSTK